METIRNPLMVLIGLSACALLGPSPASAGPDVLSDVAPPPDRAERAPAPRDGYDWRGGHWEWTGRFYKWVSGTWVTAHRGAHWATDRWDQVGTQWHFTPGHREQ
jgi:hypothetical protein